SGARLPYWRRFPARAREAPPQLTDPRNERPAGDGEREAVESDGHARSTCGVRELRQPPVRRSVRQRAAAVDRLLVAIGRCLRFSSPPGLAGPAAHETLLLCGCVVGTEVGIPLVRLSPSFSWTRGSLSTSDCRQGPSSAPEHAS